MIPTSIINPIIAIILNSLFVTSKAPNPPVRANGTDIPSATISRLLAVGTSSLFNGSTVVTLAAGSVIDMALSALLAVGITLGNGVNATLTVKKLD